MDCHINDSAVRDRRGQSTAGTDESGTLFGKTIGSSARRERAILAYSCAVTRASRCPRIWHELEFGITMRPLSIAPPAQQAHHPLLHLRKPTMKRPLSLAVAPLVWLFLATTLCAQADPLSVIPDDAWGVAVIRDISDTSARVGKLTQKMQIPAPDLLTLGKSLRRRRKGAEREREHRGGDLCRIRPTTSGIQLRRRRAGDGLQGIHRPVRSGRRGRHDLAGQDPRRRRAGDQERRLRHLHRHRPERALGAISIFVQERQVGRRTARRMAGRATGGRRRDAGWQERALQEATGLVPRRRQSDRSRWR